MSDFPMKTPVALLIFNRPDTTEKVFAAIRQAKPPKLLVVADGPRPDRPDDIEKCKAARAIIEQVDWDCEVFKNYSDVNLGCKDRVSSGLDWVFNTVEEAIILEDDCLPDLSFFQFCDILLAKYKNDERIMQISGTNCQHGNWRGDGTYYFTQGGSIWGWATWARSWKLYDDEMKNLNYLQNYINYILCDKVQAKVRMRNFRNDTSVWDHRWAYTIYCNHGLSIVPNKNLIINIGFNENASHTVKIPKFYTGITLESLVDIKHPSLVVPHIEADDYEFYLIYPQYKSYLRRVLLFWGIEERLIQMKSKIKKWLVLSGFVR